MVWMTRMEDWVMRHTGCTRTMANDIINTVLEEDRKANEEDA